MSGKYITLEDLCQVLSITRATGRNWLRLGKIESQKQIDGKEYFSENYAFHIKEELVSGNVKALRSRRNKRYVTGKSFYDKYVSDGCVCRKTVSEFAGVLAEAEAPLTDTAMRSILADCALKLLISSEMPEITACRQCDDDILYGYVENGADIGCWQVYIDDIIGDKEGALIWIQENKELLGVHYEYSHGEDVLGLLYMSIRDIGSRKAAGAYYTPTDVVRRMVADVADDINIIGDRPQAQSVRIMDPCCGTGNFLMQFPPEIPLCSIYACDIDELSVQLARFNLALSRANCRKYMTDEKRISINEEEAGTICENITCQDFIRKDNMSGEKYDVIIGNPPWGYTFDKDMWKYLRENYRTAGKRGIESYDVFVERSLELLSDGGRLEFVLPEAVLDVSSHHIVRQVMSETSNIGMVRFLGDVFHGVQCPAITLQLIKSDKPGHSFGARIERAGGLYTIEKDRPLQADNFLLRISDAEYEMLHRLENAGSCTSLRQNADFAMGIVTGDNKKYISEEMQPGREPIVTGADVYRYGDCKSEKYIETGIGMYQQAAPEEMYRVPEKLIYRFVNRQLVFAYDDRRRLTLNSCNVVIPHIQELDMKYIMAVLNSRISQYIFEKKYNSVKVLRSHIESIPIPLADEGKQRQVVRLAEQLIKMSADKSENLQKRYSVYDAIDDIVRRLYGLDSADYEFVKSSLTGDKYMI